MLYVLSLESCLSHFGADPRRHFGVTATADEIFSWDE